MEPAAQAVEQVVEGAKAAANWPRLFHVFGVISYVGSLLAVARMVALLPSTPVEHRAFAASAARRTYLTVTFPAMIVLLLAGLHSAFANPGNREYLKEPWFLMKMTLVLLVITIDHVLVVRPLKQLVKGTADPSAQPTIFRAGFWIVSLLFFALLMTLYVFRYM